MGPNANNSRPHRASKLRYCHWLATTLCLASPLVLATAQSAAQQVPASPSGSITPRPLIAADLDWYPRSALTSEQQRTIPPFCPGAYIEPANDSPSAGVPFDLAPINATADDSKVVPNQRAVLNGNVHLNRGNLRLTADHAVVNFVEKKITLDGTIVVRDTGRMVRGDHAVLSTADGTGTIDNAHYVFYATNTRGDAAAIRRVSDTISKLTRGSYTHCPPGDETWLLTAKDIKIDHATGMGTAKSAVLRLVDVPVFYIPYVTFPIDNRRRSGFLWPTLSSAKGTGGIDLTVPYYWNIAPNTDATIAPRYIKDRGLDTELEFRHLNRYSNLVTSGSYIDDQDYGDKRWLIGVNEHGPLSPGWFHSIQYTKVSDDQYFNDLATQSLEVKRQTHLLQQAGLTYFGSTWHFGTIVRRYQTIEPTVDTPYEILPQMTLAKDWGQTPFRPDWQFLAEATYFDIPDARHPRGSRLYMAPGLGFPMEWTWGFVKPVVKALGVTYRLDQQRLAAGVNATPSAVAPLVSLDSGLYFDRITSLFGHHYTQTLEPRLYYLYVPPRDQHNQPLFDTSAFSFDYHQLWRESRFTGHDRIADANQVSFGVATNLVDNEAGITTLSASIGQIYYIGNRNVTLNSPITATERNAHSDLAAEMTWRPADTLTATGSVVWDPNTGIVDNAGIQMSYRGPHETIFNVGQRYRRNVLQTINSHEVIADINQSDVSAILPIARKWALLGRWNYDYVNNRNLEQLVGVEYNSCCWRFRVLYQAGVDGNNVHTEGVYLQFQLKGLGGLGGSVDGILKDSILGYTLRENSLQ